MRNWIRILLVAVALSQAAMAAELNWLTDFAKAQAKAKKEHKLLLMDFTGSDWCGGCKLLAKNVFSSKEFADFAKDNLVLLTIDFPNFKELPAKQRKANDAIAEKFDVEGFPSLVVLGPDGKERTRLNGYHGESSKDIIAAIKETKKEAAAAK